VFFLAGYRAGVTANAAGVVNDKTVAHFDDVSLLFSCRLTSIVS
jgi:hypothetical protein